MLEQRTKGFLAVMRLKESFGTLVMPVLAQMMLAREAVRSAVLWVEVKMPGFSYHNLSTAKRTQCCP